MRPSKHPNPASPAPARDQGRGRIPPLPPVLARILPDALGLAALLAAAFVLFLFAGAFS